MQKKTIGMVLIVLGILMMVYTGFNLVTKEKVVDFGPIEISQKTNHPIQWSPYVGFALLIGGAFLTLSKKKS
ncbi:LPXTG cell wall anchor domain-containing protein [Sediminicola arcticus]|jgi:LPXTG-motif cell wall-anchored protein|uniref:LPXTG cell wall anchor domain-containing protein n=1 Tax=Sediminicola arcticus TaxID=1574308 RepID=A0ABV2SS59_9FLAO